MQQILYIILQVLALTRGFLIPAERSLRSVKKYGRILVKNEYKIAIIRSVV